MGASPNPPRLKTCFNPELQRPYSAKHLSDESVGFRTCFGPRRALQDKDNGLADSSCCPPTATRRAKLSWGFQVRLCLWVGVGAQQKPPTTITARSLIALKPVSVMIAEYANFLSSHTHEPNNCGNESFDHLPATCAHAMSLTSCALCPTFVSTVHGLAANREGACQALNGTPTVNTQYGLMLCN